MVIGRAPVALAVAIACTSIAAPAKSTVIAFDTVTPGMFTGQATEANFNYGVSSGVLYGNSLGDPGADLEGSVLSGGGIATFTEQFDSLFTFSGLDYAAFNGLGSGTQTLEVRGYLNGTLLGTDSFILGNTDQFLPSFGNWTTFYSAQLQNTNINRLEITLSASLLRGDVQVLQAIDNIRFGPAAAPESSTWAMMLLGFGAMGVALRRGRSTKAPTRAS